jgi:cytochrome c-type biogenesis protein CcmH
VRILALLFAVALFASPAAALAAPPSASELETELVCPVCHETLDESTSPVAEQMKAEIRRRIRQGWTKQQIIDEMVANYGPAVLSTPGRHGFDLLAWVLPLGGAAAGVAALGAGARYWTHTTQRAVPDGPRLDPEMEERIDEELRRFDG